MNAQNIPVPREGYVRVECVWPEERGPKEDCRAGTGIVWAGHGDVQNFPTILWPQLAKHPDVWRLYDDDASAALREAEQRQREISAEQARVLAEAQEKAREEEQARIAAAAKEQGQSTNTDVVSVLVDGAATQPPEQLTAEQLAEMPDDEIRALSVERGYELHPRLTPANLRTRFLEAQAAAAEAEA